MELNGRTFAGALIFDEEYIAALKREVRHELKSKSEYFAN